MSEKLKYQRSVEGEQRRLDAVRKATLGRKQTDEHKLKMVATRKKNNSFQPNSGSFTRENLLGHKFNIGRKQSDEWKQHKSEWMLKNAPMRGKTHTLEARKKISLKAFEQFKDGMPIETRRKISESHKGEKSYLWKGGISPLNVKIRTSDKYRYWRSDIFKRDNWLCRTCNNKGYLIAHHIKEFSKIVQENNIKTFDEAMLCEELWNIANGITLCLDCHKVVHRKDKLIVGCS